ncbi:MAG: conjugal transfer protein TraX [Clostridiales bacterium]|nr:conjugal transfer protein TraX [Clostridiales bacterium]
MIAKRRRQGQAGGYGFSANALKAVAIATMLVDHAAHALVVPDTTQNLIIYGVMRFIGRITAPVMFYFIVEGYHYTRDKNRYTIRLAVFAAVSYLPFVWFMTGGPPRSGTYLELNVIYTLLVGFLALRAYREIESVMLRALALVALTVASIPGDWTYIAVFCILAFERFYGDFPRQAKAYIIITLVTGAQDFFYPVIGLITGKYVSDISFAIALINLGRFVPIGLLYFYNGTKGSGGKLAQWGFYAFYPLHLIALCVLAAR